MCLRCRVVEPGSGGRLSVPRCCVVGGGAEVWRSAAGPLAPADACRAGLPLYSAWRQLARGRPRQSPLQSMDGVEPGTDSQIQRAAEPPTPVSRLRLSAGPSAQLSVRPSFSDCHWLRPSVSDWPWPRLSVRSPVLRSRPSVCPSVSYRWHRLSVCASVSRPWPRLSVCSSVHPSPVGGPACPSVRPRCPCHRSPVPLVAPEAPPARRPAPVWTGRRRWSAL